MFSKWNTLTRYFASDYVEEEEEEHNENNTDNNIDNTDINETITLKKHLTYNCFSKHKTRKLNKEYSLNGYKFTECGNALTILQNNREDR